MIGPNRVKLKGQCIYNHFLGKGEILKDLCPRSSTTGVISHKNINDMKSIIFEISLIT